ncbi:hypothetical protein MTR67_048289, partial [Solanum verrucosum]
MATPRMRFKCGLPSFHDFREVCRKCRSKWGKLLKSAAWLAKGLVGASPKRSAMAIKFVVWSATLTGGLVKLSVARIAWINFEVGLKLGRLGHLRFTERDSHRRHTKFFKDFRANPFGEPDLARQSDS